MVAAGRRLIAAAAGRPLAWPWLLAAVALLAFPARFWSTPAGRATLAPPAAAVLRSNPALGRAVRFLEAAAPLVPPGATFTVRADSAEAEMEAYMVAVGVVAHARALPSSYYGTPLPAVGGTADYLLALPGAVLAEAGLQLVAEVGGGRVLRRPGRL